MLFLGDHDLTSLALALLRPGARLSVVDVDDDLLECIDRTAADLADAVPLGELWRLNERHAIARPERRPPLPEVAAADLRHLPELAPRLLLTNRVARLQLVLGTCYANALLHPNGWPARLLAPRTT